MLVPLTAPGKKEKKRKNMYSETPLRSNAHTLKEGITSEGAIIYGLDVIGGGNLATHRYTHADTLKDKGLIM